jgi:hypothetical protein
LAFEAFTFLLPANSGGYFAKRMMQVRGKHEKARWPYRDPRAFIKHVAMFKLTMRGNAP